MPTALPQFSSLASQPLELFLCHPERSSRIRFANPTAKSKDPYSLKKNDAVSGSSPETSEAPR